jgi:hypothetical protein
MANGDTQSFDVQSFLHLISRHARAESAGKLDAVMDTICNNPHYEIHPLGLIITTRAAVHEYYRRILPIIAAAAKAAGPGPAGNDPLWKVGDANTFIGANAIITRDNMKITDSGKTIPIKALSIWVWDRDSNLISGEHVYLNGAICSVIKDAITDFASFPGVVVE